LHTRGERGGAGGEAGATRSRFIAVAESSREKPPGSRVCRRRDQASFWKGEIMTSSARPVPLRAPLTPMVLPALAMAAAASLLAPPAAAQEERVLEEVVVTARFREERLQDTPLAITAYTADMMDARNLTDVTHLDTFSPNTIIQPLGAGWGSTAAAFIRGVGLGDNSLSFEPGVPIYIDDVYHGRPQGAILDLLDLERVEVLRGPQGTLFGKNAIGGTIRLVSRRPQGDNTGTVEVTAGRYDRLDLRGSYDIALAERFFARFSASSKRRDGYFDLLDYECVNGPGSLGGGGTGILPGATHETFGIPLPLPETPPVNLQSQLGPQDIRAEEGCVVDTLGNENVTTGRAMFRWLAADAVELNISMDVTKIDQAGPSDKYTFMNPAHPFNQSWSENVAVPVFGLPYDTRFLTDSPYSGYHRFGSDPLFNRDVQNINVLDHWGAAATLEWAISDNVQLKSITSYREFENTFGRDSDGTPLPVDHTWDTSIHEQWTQEIQVTGLAADQRLDWAAGFFYYDATDSNQGWNFLYPFILSNNNHKDVQTIRSWAVFVHGTYQLTDRLSLTAGLRHTDDQKDVSIFRQNFFTGDVIIPNTQVSVDAQELSPKLGLTWNLRDDLMTYVQWSTGFRGGGFGPRPANPLQVAAFDVETLETIEAGAKTSLLDGRLRINSAVFYSEYADQQQFSQQFDPSGAVWFRTVNTGESEYHGAEVEIFANPVDRLQIEASVGWLRFDRVDPGESGLCRHRPDGSRCPAPRAPEWSGALGAHYTWGLANGGALRLHGNATYRSRIYFGTDPIFGSQPRHTLVDGRLTWLSPDEGWAISLFGTNLTDEVYFHGKLSLVTVLGREQGNVARPREWGLSLRRSF
jgi:iron complex outermembrane recepter protein